MSALLSTLRSTLAQLVAIDSTSSLSNAPMIAVLESRLRASAFTCQRYPYRDESGTEKINLVALKGPGGYRPALALVGHTDCVPFDAAWKEALTLTERDGCLVGRGACDTKAYLACALAAAANAPALGQPLMLVFTADEELGCLGAKQLIQDRAISPRYAIVGEPTSLTPIRANKGYCLAEVEVLGKEGHSAYPETGASAIFGAAELLRRIEDAVTDLRRESHPDFEPPYTTLNVGVISGGKAKNVIPGSCRFFVEWRPIPGQAPERGRMLLEGLCRNLEREKPGVTARLKSLRSDVAAESSATSEVVKFLVAESGKAPGTVAFGTEAAQLAELGAEAVVFGPGDIRHAHQTGEFVPIDELVECERILEAAVARFCGP